MASGTSQLLTLADG